MVAEKWNTMKKIAKNAKSGARPESKEYREMLAEYNRLVRIAKHTNEATLLAAKISVTDLSTEDSNAPANPAKPTTVRTKSPSPIQTQVLMPWL